MTPRRIFVLLLTVLLLAMLVAAPLCGQTSGQPVPAWQLRGLGSTLRVLQITAHPGDEDGALLAYFAQGAGARVTLLTLTRGERGDSHEGVRDPGEQGLVRTLEQQAADRIYGVEQRYTRVVDFGYTRKSSEVFDRWLGHNPALADMVRVVRETRPQIIVVPFDLAGDGDGQHEATLILAREAFKAAADPKKFPEQLKDGLEVWQPRRLFALARTGTYTVEFHADETPRGGAESWQQIGQRALQQERSQLGLWHAPGGSTRRYRMIEAAPGFELAEGAHDSADGVPGFAVGINAQLETLAADSGLNKDSAQTAERRLRLMRAASDAAAQSLPDAVATTSHLAEYLQNLRSVEDLLLGGRGNAVFRAELLWRRAQAEHLFAQAAGVKVQALLKEDGAATTADAANVLVPGMNYTIEVRAELGSATFVRDCEFRSFELRSEGGRWTPAREWKPGEAHAVFRGRVPLDAPFTRPQFLLGSEDDAVYRILDAHNATRPLPPPPLEAVVEVQIGDELARIVVPVQAMTGGAPQPLAVAPPMSVIVQPRTHWNRRTRYSYGEMEVRVRSNVANLQNALLTVHPPSGWHTEPEHEMLEIATRGDEHTYRFFMVQDRGGEGAFPSRGIVRWGNAVFDQGYTVVRAAGGVAFHYRSSDGVLVSTAVDLPEGLSVGYVGLPGDNIPAALRDMNIRVVTLDAASLESERLERYWSIVLGPGVVDTRDELAAQRERLLSYVKGGGVVLILGQTDTARFATNAPLPYPLELGTARVSNAYSAVEFPEQHHELLQEPNDITEEDFRGWSEERGHNFALHWDGRYEALLRMKDAGQPVQEGALLRARYGRGSVIYSGLAFHRQLDAGAAGALKLLINLLSAGAELHR